MFPTVILSQAVLCLTLWASPALAQDGPSTYQGPIQGFPSTVAPAEGGTATAASTSSSASNTAVAATMPGASGSSSASSTMMTAMNSSTSTSSSMAAASSDATSAQVNNVIAALNAAGLTTLATTIQGNSGLSGELSMLVMSGTNVTILAPTDAAFQAANATALMNATFVQELLNYHILHSPNMTSMSNSSTSLPTALNSFLPYNGTGTAADAGFQAVIASVDASGNLTSISQGNMPAINVTGGPVQVGNIKVQSIPMVLPLPSSLPNTLMTLGLSSALGAIESSQLMSNGSGTAGNLSDMLSMLNGVTVFAPTNQAFTNAMPIISRLNATEVGSVLEYHVVDGAAVYTSNVTSTFSVPTYNGNNLNINKTGAGVIINGYSNVVMPYEVATSNGVVTVVDQVLFPPDIMGKMYSSALLGATDSAAAAASTSTYIPGNGPLPSGSGVMSAVENLATGGTGNAGPSSSPSTSGNGATGGATGTGTNSGMASASGGSGKPSKGAYSRPIDSGIAIWAFLAVVGLSAPLLL